MIFTYSLLKTLAMLGVKMSEQPTRSNRRIDQVLRIKKLTSHNIIKRAAMHNLREIKAEYRSGDRIDSTRTQLNQILTGSQTSSRVVEDYDKLLDAANLPTKIRRDAVRGIEVVISLPSDHEIDELTFFDDCTEWCRSYFGVPVLSVVIHRDEPNPHSHTILVPLVGGRLQGSKLAGNRTKWRAMQESFYESVGVRYGFTRPLPMVRYSYEFRRTIAAQIVDSLAANSEYLNNEQVQGELIQVVSNDPLDLARMVGIGV